VILQAALTNVDKAVSRKQHHTHEVMGGVRCKISRRV
jgi:hypothetical protein